MTVPVIILILALIYIAITLFLVFKFAFMVLKPNNADYEKQMEESVSLKRFTREYIDNLDKEEFTVKSRYGYTLHGIIENNGFSRKEENSKRVAVLCHGYTSGKISMSGYAKRLMDLGFTCVLYDHRNHGDNAKSMTEGRDDTSICTSMSYYEKYDLQTVLDYCYDRFGSDIKLITYGESMGSATILGLYEIDSRPVLSIADCSFSDATELFRYMLTEIFHIPPIFPILPLADLVLKRVGKFSMKDIHPIEGAKKAEQPILFCHGASDVFIPCSMSQDMSNVGPGPREIHLFEGAGHALSEVTDPEGYSKAVADFINKYYK